MPSRQVERAETRRYLKDAARKARVAQRRAQALDLRRRQSAREKRIAAGELKETRSLVTLMGRHRDVVGRYERGRFRPNRGWLARYNELRAYVCYVLERRGFRVKRRTYLHPTRGFRPV